VWRCIIAPVVTEQALFILASLARGELHGYGIARDVEELSDGQVKLTAGTLYGALNRLTEEGLIAQTRERLVEGRRRRYYRLTGAGQAALAEEAERLRAKAAALSARSTIRAGRRPRPA
jgi:DNA-binding PadR family transcriptional regulator